MLTDEQIRFLRRFPKTVAVGWDLLLMPTTPTPNNPTMLRGSLVIPASTGRSDLPGKLTLYSRLNTLNLADFSTGLVYTDANAKDYHVLRLNGSHGVHVNNYGPAKAAGNVYPQRFHHVPHIHFLTARYQRMSQPDGFAVITQAYSDITTAIQVLGRRANIASQFPLGFT